MVECTGSLSNSGSTNLPNVSTDSTAASKGVSSDNDPNDTWSAPIASYTRIVLIASSGVPTAMAPISIALLTCSSGIGGVSFGVLSIPAACGKLSRYFATSDVW